MVNLIATAQIAPFRSFEEATEVLCETANRGGVANLSYWYLKYDGDEVGDVYWLSTYSPEYMGQYMAHCTPGGDPVMELLFKGASIVEWEHESITDTERELLERAKRNGISNLGFTLGQRIPPNVLVAFSVNAPGDATNWHLEKEFIAERFRNFSRVFHQRIEPLLIARETGRFNVAV